MTQPSMAPYPPPDAKATAESIERTLAEALARRDAAAVDESTRGAFTTLFYPTGGSNTESGFRDTYLQPAGRPVRFEPLPPGLAPITETIRGVFDPSHVVYDVLFSRGWGPEGRGESQLILLQEPSGHVRLAGMVYAESGFTGSADAPPPATRVVDLSLDGATTLSVQIPAAWHVTTIGRGATVTSYRPWEWALEGGWEQGFPPGTTKLEFVGPDSHDAQTLSDALAAVNSFGQPPTSRDEERLTLASGEEAALARYSFATQELLTMLFVVLDDGVAIVPCHGDQSPCESVFRTVSVEPE